MLPRFFRRRLTGAWALYGGEPFQVAGVGVAIVAAYIGGMLLNDVFDLPFDQLHHPDRPLPQGFISRSHGIAAAILCGILTLALAGSQAQTEAVILLAAIVLYSWCHKSSVWRAALLLGICRGMAVLLAAAMLGDGASGISTPIVLTLTVAHGAGGAAITVAASQEHQQRPGPGGVVPLTRLLPLGVFVLLDPREVRLQTGRRILACGPCWDGWFGKLHASESGEAMSRDRRLGLGLPASRRWIWWLLRGCCMCHRWRWRRFVLFFLASCRDFFPQPETLMA